MIDRNRDCKIYEPLVSAMLDGELAQAEQEELETHLNGCPSCRQQLVVFARVDQAVGALSEIGTDHEGTAIPIAAGRSLASHGRPAKKRLAFSVWRLIPLAVAATVLVCLGIVMLPSPNPATAKQISPEEFVRPIKDLHFINLQQQRDQQLMLRTLGMDLRSLRLEIAMLETESNEQDNLKNEVNAMIEKVRNFELLTQTNFE